MEFVFVGIFIWFVVAVIFRTVLAKWGHCYDIDFSEENESGIMTNDIVAAIWPVTIPMAIFLLTIELVKLFMKIARRIAYKISGVQPHNDRPRIDRG